MICWYGPLVNNITNPHYCATHIHPCLIPMYWKGRREGKQQKHDNRGWEARPIPPRVLSTMPRVLYVWSSSGGSGTVLVELQMGLDYRGGAYIVDGHLTMKCWCWWIVVVGCAGLLWSGGWVVAVNPFCIIKMSLKHILLYTAASLRHHRQWCLLTIYLCTRAVL